MRAMRRSFCAALFGVVLLAGCATVHPVPTTVVTPGMPNPEEALRQSIQHVDAEMAELGQLSPSVARPDTPVMPEDLQRIVTFQWSGPLDQGVAKLAQSVGYTFYTTAPPNAQPIKVTIQIPRCPPFRCSRHSARRRARGRPCKSIHSTTRCR